MPRLLATRLRGPHPGRRHCRRAVLTSRPVHAAAPSSDTLPALTAHGLCCVRDDRRLFEGVGFALPPGEAVEIEGTNGSGKTTLLRAICGLIMPDAGSIHWQGHDVVTDPEPLRRALTYVGHAIGAKRDLTPRENLEAALALAGAGTQGDACGKALERVGLSGCADTPLRRLSAGQVRRVALARLLLRSNPLWVLDEPFSALDRGGKALLEELIIEHCSKGGMVLLTTHQPADLGSVPLQAIVLGDRP